MSTKLAFFDLDYTLSDLYFKLDDGTMVNGMHTDKWKEFCKSHPEDAYKDCKPVNIVALYAKQLQSNGAELFVLTSISDNSEIKPKINFINEHYPDLFDKYHILFAHNYDKDKISNIKLIARIKDIPLDECELIEDNYCAVLYAIDNGIKGTHVTKIFNNFSLE